jgi:mRNA interferase RelE/StbE
LIRYKVSLTPSARKSLLALSKPDQKRLSIAIELLSENPIPPKASKLKGRQGYRIRVGNFRVIYSFDGKQLTILILDIGHRREVYTRVR